MAHLKSDIIEDAYSKIRLSGLTITPGPRENQLALRRLEQLAAILTARQVFVGYLSEDEPDAGSATGLKVKYHEAFASNLAIRLLNDYGKEPPPMLMAEARGGMSFLFSQTIVVTPAQYPARQPVGSGNYPYRFIRTAPLTAEEIAALEEIVGLEMVDGVLMVDGLEMT